MSEIARFRLVLAVADSGGIGAAARAAGTSQPTVSRALREVEVRLGRSLFSRTAAGTLLRPDAADTIARMRRIVADYDDLVGHETGDRLRIGYAWAGLPPVLDRVLAAWREQTGTGCELLQFDDPHRELVGLGTVDLVVERQGPTSPDRTGLGTLRLGTEPRIAAVNADGPFAAAESLDLDELSARGRLVANSRSGSVPVDLWGRRPTGPPSQHETATAHNTATWLSMIGAEPDRFGITSTSTAEFDVHPHVVYRRVVGVPDAVIELRYLSPPGGRVAAFLDVASRNVEKSN